jgi:hypothetical protein
MHNPLETLIQKLPSDFCLLCGGVPTVTGVFVPETPETWGGIAGKKRIFRYCLCSKCQEQIDTPENVEKIIRSELFGGGVINE